MWILWETISEQKGVEQPPKQPPGGPHTLPTLSQGLLHRVQPTQPRVSQARHAALGPLAQTSELHAAPGSFWFFNSRSLRYRLWAACVCGKRHCGKDEICYFQIPPPAAAGWEERAAAAEDCSSVTYAGSSSPTGSRWWTTWVFIAASPAAASAARPLPPSPASIRICVTLIAARKKPRFK